MLKLIIFELQKVWRKNVFIGVLIALLTLNVFLLWYTTQGNDSNPQLSAYSAYHNDLRQLPNNEQLNFIKQYYDEIKGVELVENVKLYESWQTENGDNMAASLRENSSEIYTKFLPLWESGKFLRYTDNIRQEILFAEKIYDEADNLNHYEDFLQDVEKEGDILSGISIFSSKSSDGFSIRNIQKISADYNKMHGTYITYDISFGVVAATSAYFSDLLIFLFLFIFAVMLIFEEKEKHLFSLTKITPRGKLESITAKIFSLMVNTAVVTLLIFGSNLLFFHFTTGLGDLGRSLQSIGDFIGSTMKLSVGDYLLFFLLTKWLVCFTIGLFVLLVSIVVKHSSISYLVCSSVLLLSYVLSVFIPVNSQLTFLKYINLVGLFQVQNMYGIYLNLNVFGNAVSLIDVSVGTILVLLIAMWVASVISFISIRNMVIGISPMKKLFSEKLTLHYRPYKTLAGHETYKVLIMNKASIFLVLFAALILYRTFSVSVYLSPDENYYMTYMNYLQGEVTEEKSNYLKIERERFEGIHAELAEIDLLLKHDEITKTQAEAMSAPLEKQLNAENTFERVWQQYEYLQTQPKGEFVYDTGYLSLFDTKGVRGKSELLILCIILVLCSYDVFSMEYTSGAWKLISTTPCGRRNTVNRKILISMIMTVIAFFANIIPVLITIGRTYGFSSLSASINSLQAYAMLPSSISIIGFTVILYLLKLLACLSMVMIIIGLSQLGKHGMYSMLLSVVVLVLPILLVVMGLDWCSYFSLLSLFSAGHYLSETQSLMVIGYMISAILIGYISYIYLNKDFGKAR